MLLTKYDIVLNKAIIVVINKQYRHIAQLSNNSNGIISFIESYTKYFDKGCGHDLVKNYLSDFDVYNASVRHL